MPPSGCDVDLNDLVNPADFCLVYLLTRFVAVTDLDIAFTEMLRYDANLLTLIQNVQRLCRYIVGTERVIYRVWYHQV